MQTISKKIKEALNIKSLEGQQMLYKLSERGLALAPVIIERVEFVEGTENEIAFICSPVGGQGQLRVKALSLIDDTPEAREVFKNKGAAEQETQKLGIGSMSARACVSRMKSYIKEHFKHLPSELQTKIESKALLDGENAGQYDLRVSFRNLVALKNGAITPDRFLNENDNYNEDFDD